MRRILLLAVIGGVVAFYFWTVTTGQLRYLFPEEVQDYDYYNQLTDGFANGHLYLKKAPAPELLALKNPYDPVANENYRLLDASLYRGHYYIYWGPVPVMVLYLPYYLFTGEHFPENLGVGVFATAAYLVTCWLWFVILKRLRVEQPFWLTLLMAASLGICQFFPYVLRQPMMYECAVFAGCFFVAAGFGLWLQARLNGHLATYAAAGLCFGLAAGSRPQFALLAVAYVVTVAVQHVREVKKIQAVAAPKILAAAAPVLFCGLALMWYNWARFDNPLEFGVKYQLGRQVIEAEGWRPTWDKFVAGLYYYLIHPFFRRDTFPFIEFVAGAVFTRWLPKGQYVEPVVGLLVATPVYLLGLGFPLLRLRRSGADPQVRFLAQAMWVAAMGAFLFVCPLGWAVLRYAVDFAPLFLILSLAAAGVLVSRMPRGRARSLLIGAIAGGCLWGCGLNTLTSFVGISPQGKTNGVELYNTETYNRFEKAFAEVGIGRRCLASMNYEVRVPIPKDMDAGWHIQVVTSGVAPRSNTILMEAASRDTVRIRYEQGDGHPLVSAPWPAKKGDWTRVRITYRDDRRLAILADGREVLSGTVFWFPPTGLQPPIDVKIQVDQVRRAETCSLVPEDLQRPGCSRGICDAGTSRSTVAFIAGGGCAGLRAGDTIRFAQSGARRIAEARIEGERCLATVDGPLYPDTDGYPRAMELPPL